MTLPAGFQFSQSNLQDYVDCPRRFQLRSLLHIAWPALETQPAVEDEYYLQLGTAFHHLLHQHQSGIPQNHLTASIQGDQPTGHNQLLDWWENYLNALEDPKILGDLLQPVTPLTGQRLPEISLSVPLRDFRLIAKYDLLVTRSSGSATIIDWKTNRNRPPRRWLQARLQSRVYPYVLAKAGSQFFLKKILQPEQVEMLYWFAGFPHDPEQLLYSAEQFLTDDMFLSDLVDEINRKDENDFPLTHNDKHCQYCVYRSLCDRGATAGSLNAAEFMDGQLDLGDIDIDMNQISEVVF
jgi:hypothetical protein